MTNNVILLPRPAKWPAAYRLRAVNAYRKLPEKTEAAVNQLAAEFGVRGRTLYRWVARFHDAGADGLADHKRSDAGQPRILRFPLAALFILLKRADGWSVLKIHRALRREWRRLYPGFPRPSYHHVRALVRSTERKNKVRPCSRPGHKTQKTK